MRKNKNLLRYTSAFLCGLIACLPASAATLTYPEGTTLVFNPSATLAGVNVGAIAGDPSAPVNGDIWYDSTANELTARINGANVALGSGGGSGTAAGLIYITNDSGTTTNYNPASDTDAARGTALLSAVAAATAGQTVRVGAGTFALAANRLLIPDDVCLDLDPATLITGTANLSTVGPMVRPGNRSVIRGGKIEGVAASAVSQAPFGISSFVASPDTSAVDFVLDGVTLEADSDAFYILSNEACTGTIRNCTFISKYDIIYISGYNGDPASHDIKIYNTQGIVVGPSSIASPLGRGTTIAYGATVDIHGGSLAVSDGGSTLNAGVASYEGGTVNIYGVSVTTSNGANPNYDLYTNGSGVIRVNGGAGSDTGGKYIANSGANVTYVGGNLGTATATSYNGLTVTTTTGTLTVANGKTITGSNTLTFSGTDGSTLNVGTGGTLGASAFLATSAGGNGTADNGKSVIFGTGGIIDATTEITVHNSATAAHAYLADDGTIGYHAVGDTNPRELAFPDDLTDGQSKQIATRDWVTANAAAFDATAVDAVTWSDGANASNVWTFNLSGTDPAITFASGAVNVSTGALQVAGVAVPTISSTSTLTNKRITQRVETLTDAATVTINIDNADCGTLATLSQTTTFGAPTGTPTAFQVYKMEVTSSTARTISFNAAFDDSDDQPFPTATSGGGKTDLFTFIYSPTKSKWCLAGKNFGF